MDISTPSTTEIVSGSSLATMNNLSWTTDNHSSVNITQHPFESISESQKERQGLISDSVQYYINIYFISVALSLISAFGVCTNVLNSVVFLKQGLRDCMSLSLFALTISDFGVVFCALVFSLCFAANTIDSTLTFDPYSFQVIIRWPRSMFFMMSMGITAFISLERCLCVVLPFRFKHIFTFNRTAVVVASIFVFFILSYSPIYATYGLSWQFDERTNSTRILSWLSDNRMDIEKYCNLFNQISLLTIFQIIIVVSTIVMVSGLKFSTRFRQQTSVVYTTSGVPVLTTVKADFKEIRIIKMVSILTTVCIICTMIQLTVVYARRLVVEISLNGIYGNLYNNLASSALTSGALNSSLNIFVYYNLKPRFKETLLELICCRCRPATVKATQ